MISWCKYDKKRLPFTAQYTALVQTGARSKFKSDCGGKIQMGLFYKMSKKILSAIELWWRHAYLFCKKKSVRHALIWSATFINFPSIHLFASNNLRKNFHFCAFTLLFLTWNSSKIQTIYQSLSPKLGILFALI